MFANYCLLKFFVLSLIYYNPISCNPLADFHDQNDIPTNRVKRDIPPDAYLNVKEIIQKYGYPLEVHEVTTSDGYILEMHRIPYGKNLENSNCNRPVVLLMHGLLSSSADWIIMGVDKGLGFILADAGYDVWMGNARGNTWSRKHESYDPVYNAKQFWDFSWHEIGYYDLPAKINHILNVTQQEKIFYVGHSQGTTAFFVMLSERPEYNSKIHMMSAFAPAVYMGNIPNLFLKFLAIFGGPSSVLIDLIGQYEFLPSNGLMTLLGQQLCQEESQFQVVCSNIIFLIFGYDSNQLNETMLPVIFSHAPAGASTKQFYHYGQLMNSNKFRKYDYGLLENLRRYNSISPPNYKIQNIQVPVALYYGDNDNLVSIIDVNRLDGQLPNSIIKYQVPHQQFNHVDFLWAIDVKTLLYNTAMSIMGAYQ